MASKNIIAKGTTYNGVESVTFPTSPSGTATFFEVSDTTATASDVLNSKYFYTAAGVLTQGTGTAPSPTLITKNITQNGTYDAEDDDADGYSSVTVSVSGGGGSGLVYETGTWTPTTDISNPTISFQNAHTEAPVFVMISDATGSYDGTTNTCQSFVYGDWEKAFGTTINPSTSSSQYALFRGVYRAASATATSSTGTIFTSRTSAETYVNSSRFVPNIGSGYYWRTNRTYKWIAVWAPTT